MPQGGGRLGGHIRERAEPGGCEETGVFSTLPSPPPAPHPQLYTRARPTGKGGGWGHSEVLWGWRHVTPRTREWGERSAWGHLRGRCAWGLQAASPSLKARRQRGRAGGVGQGQQVAAQKMSPWGGSDCTCQGKVKVSQPWSVTTFDHKQIYMETIARGGSQRCCTRRLNPRVSGRPGQRGPGRQPSTRRPQRPSHPGAHKHSLPRAPMPIWRDPRPAQGSARLPDRAALQPQLPGGPGCTSSWGCRSGVPSMGQAPCVWKRGPLHPVRRPGRASRLGFPGKVQSLQERSQRSPTHGL